MIGKAVDGLTDRKNLGKVCEEIDNIYQNEGDITPVMARGFENMLFPLLTKFPILPPFPPSMTVLTANTG